MTGQSDNGDQTAILASLEQQNALLTKLVADRLEQDKREKTAAVFELVTKAGLSYTKEQLDAMDTSTLQILEDTCKTFLSQSPPSGTAPAVSGAAGDPNREIAALVSRTENGKPMSPEEFEDSLVNILLHAMNLPVDKIDDEIKETVRMEQAARGFPLVASLSQ